ncbi:MAG: MFS transporter [Clostridia bacterium]|nr:MFS transporter [Clostridia bacterium]
MKQATRWAYLLVATIMMQFLGIIYVWSVFRVSLSAMFDSWTLPQISITFTIMMIMFCVGNSAVGKLYDRISSRTIYLLNALFLFVGYFGVSMGLNPARPGGSLVLLYCFYGVLCGFGVGWGFNGTLSALVDWFPDKPGLASGVMLLGLGSGALAFGGVIDRLIGVYGILTVFRIVACAVALVLTVCALILKKPGKGMSDALRNESESKALAKRKPVAQPLNEFSPVQMLKAPMFWLFFFWSMIVASGGLLVVNSAAQIATALGAYATMGLIVSLFNGCGGVFFGLLFDRFGRKLSFVLDSALLAIAGIVLILSAKTGQTFLMYIGLPLVGLSYGGSATLTTSTVRVLWGARHYAINFSIANFCLVPASILGPVLSSALQQKANGSFISTFVMLILFGMAALTLEMLLNRSIKAQSKTKPM